MSIDHAASFLHRTHPAEMWGVALPDYSGHQIDLFFRVITHFCAPGFFFLMGVSMALLARSGGANVQRHFLLRGAFLILLQFTAENLAWLFGHSSSLIERWNYGYTGGPGIPAPTTNYVGVLFALGACMMVSAFLMRAHTAVLIVVALIAQCIPMYLIGKANPAAALNPVLSLLTLPGQSGGVFVRYSMLPWLSLVLFGVLYGRFTANRPQSGRLEIAVALTLALAFVALRLAAAGDYAPFQPQGIADYFKMTKYPPSLVFQAFTMTGVFAALAVFLNIGASRVLSTFGKGTLFFYIAHLYLLGAISWVFRAGLDWLPVLACDMLVLIVLYFACEAWARFKATKPRSSLVHLM
jgi:uncharacterized membrane protein